MFASRVSCRHLSSFVVVSGQRVVTIPCLSEKFQKASVLDVSNMRLPRFAWQAWHFLTCGRVATRVEVAVSVGEAAKPFLFEGVNMSRLEEVSHEMLVLTLPHLSS